MNFFSILGGISVTALAIPSIPTYYLFRRHLAVHLQVSVTHFVMWGPWPPRDDEIWRSNF